MSAGVLPLATDDVIRSMVENFKQRHRGAKVSVDRLPKLRECVKHLAAGYFRYSCENSNPTSIEDQMLKCLAKAASDERYIPWEYVFADYSVTGLDASRQGYTSLKTALADAEQPIETLYVDDFTRPSRDELEWWRLAHLVKKLRKRMIGASDNFDLSSEQWDVYLTIFGLMSRLFIKSLRQKVSRGMTGAAQRGTCLGKLSLGFTKRHKLDVDGRPVVGGDGHPVYEPCVDPRTSEYRLLMYRLYVHENWSIQRILRHFNALEVDDWNGWSSTTIRKLLWSPTAIGVFVWNKFRRELDPETEQMTKVRNPRAEWQVRYDRNLGIVPMELWRAARRKLTNTSKKSAAHQTKRSRNQMAPTTLFSGTLYCACCNSELKLIRSTPTYKQMGSLNGMQRAHGCQLTGSKSTRQIEESLLGYLKEHLLTDEVIQELVDLANAALETEAQKPRPNLVPLVRRAEQIRKQIQRLVRRSAQTDDDCVANSYAAEIKRLRMELAEIEPQLRSAEVAEQQRFARLDVHEAKKLLGELRDVLNRDVAIAGPAIRALTGPIRIRQEPIPGLKMRNRWIARFTPQVGQLLSRVCPSDCGRFAATHLPPDFDEVEVVIEKTPSYELKAAEYTRLRESGASISAIAVAHRQTRQQVVNTLTFAESAARPPKQRKKERRNSSTQTGRPGYQRIAEDVVRLREVERLSFREIARRLGCSVDMAYRGYDYLRHEEIATGVENGRPLRRGKQICLPGATFDTIRRLAKQGRSVSEISKVAKCSKGTVYLTLGKDRKSANEDLPTKTSE